MSESDLIKHCLRSLNFKALNDMQQKTLHSCQNTKNTLLLSPTGSGKTFGYLLPLYLQLKKTNSPNTQAIIIAPTRELALQIAQVWRAMQTGLKCVSCYGGHRIQVEMNELTETPQLIIGTPGRIIDHLVRTTINPEFITNIIVDEYDKTLELGFEAELNEIVTALKSIEHRVLASATEMNQMPIIFNEINFETINFTKEQDGEKLKIAYVTSYEKDKIDTLVDLLYYLGDTTSIVFVNHREAAERVNELLLKNKVESVFYHGGLEQIDRTLAIGSNKI
jgi:superfamily II DNA/RNA helicase